MSKYLLSISCIIFFLIVTILYFISNTLVYVKNKELKHKYNYNYVLTIFLQSLLVCYLLWLIIHRINNKYLGFKEYN